MKKVNHLSRRSFLKNTAIASAGLVIGFHLSGKARPGALVQAQSDETFEPNAWVKVDTDNTVTIIVSKSEMGQGVSTALPMIVAEELDADWSTIRIEQAPADEIYGNQVTWGSQSVPNSYASLRQVGATARNLLITAAAQMWEVDPSTCRTENSMVIHDDSSQQLSYGELVPTAVSLSTNADEEVALKDPADFRIIGTRLPRRDTPDIVTGTAVFSLDVRQPDMLYAVLARCPYIGGSLSSFDATAAEQVEGVQHVIEIGNSIAIVADNTWAALQGRGALEIVWDAGENAQLSSAEIWTTFEQQVDDLIANDAEGVSDDSDHILEAVYRLPYLAHATMEPMNCTADIREDSGEVWAPTQVPMWAKEAAAEASGLPIESITLHVTRLGGGFGRRSVSDFVTEAVQVSQAIGAPVKVFWSREDDIKHDFYHPATYHHLRVGMNAENQILQWRHYLAAANGRGTMGTDIPPYLIEDSQTATAPITFPVPTGIWRSVDFFHNVFVIESFIDEIAIANGADPYQYRYEMAANDRLKAVLELAAQQSDWGSPMPEGSGRGIAGCAYTYIDAYAAHVVEVSVDDDGNVRVDRVVCAFDCGTVINPEILETQIEGSIVYALTAALKGEITVEGGQIQQGNFNDVTLLRMNEMPTIEIHIVESTDTPKGAGEPAVPPLAPALANAIFAATGTRIRQLPIRPEDLQTS